MTTESKLNIIAGDLAEIKSDLREHMRRTAAAEARIDQMEQPVKELASMTEDLKYLVSLAPNVRKYVKIGWLGLGAIVMAALNNKPEVLGMILQVLGLSTGVSP